MADPEELGDGGGSSKIEDYGPSIPGQNAPIPAGRMDTTSTAERGFVVKGEKGGGYHVTDQDKLPSRNLRFSKGYKWN